MGSSSLATEEASNCVDRAEVASPLCNIVSPLSICLDLKTFDTSSQTNQDSSNERLRKLGLVKF